MQTKIPDTSGKIPSISSIVTTTALIAVKNRIPAVSNLVKKKRDNDVEILDIKFKYFTTADYNRFTNEKLNLKIKQK